MNPEQLTIIALLFGIAGAGLRQLWVWGWVYQGKIIELNEMKTDRDFWRDSALRLLGHTEAALEKAEKKNGGQ